MSDTPDELSVLAGEYVLGVLDAAEAAAVARQAAVDPLLAEAIAGWEVRLAPLAELVQPRIPPSELWTRIERTIGGGASVPEPTGFRRGLRAVAPWRASTWRAATFASLALAAAFAALAFLPQGEPAVRVAALVPAGVAAPAFLAEARNDGTVVLTAFDPAPVPAGRDLQLWLLPKGAAGVTSAGVLPASGNRVVLPRLAEGAKLLVSLEQKGGSPTGQPLGPVLYSGTLVAR